MNSNCFPLSQRARWRVHLSDALTVALVILLGGAAHAAGKADPYYLQIRAYDTMLGGKRVPAWPGIQVWNGADLDPERARDGSGVPPLSVKCTILTSGIASRAPGWWEFPDPVTLSCVALALGDPPVHVRATLLGHGAETVLQGNSYSDSYGYCFPFLWVQGEARGTSVYPAVFEWYRGETPAVVKAELLKKEPLTVKVTTRSGQVDEYTATPDGFSAVSYDAQGVRWAKFSGLANFQGKDIALKADRAGYATTITAMDYKALKLATQDPLPENPGVSIGNEGRQSYLELQGKGTAYTWEDDLLVHEGKVVELKILDAETIALKTNQDLIFAGLGDTISIPADITINRSGDGYEIRTNIRLGGTVGKTAFRLEPAAGVQKTQAR